MLTSAFLGIRSTSQPAFLRLAQLSPSETDVLNSHYVLLVRLKSAGLAVRASPNRRRALDRGKSSLRAIPGPVHVSFRRIEIHWLSAILC
jgi:hypothetical protein